MYERNIQRTLPAFVIGGCAVLGTVAYARGLGGGFLFDDFPTLVDNPALHAMLGPAHDWLALAVSSSAGILRRPVAMLSFGLDATLFGIDPYAFKVVNLGIHLLNALLIYALATRLVGGLLRTGEEASAAGPACAALAAGLWLLHPLNVSGVLYIVQRMNELSALFTLAGLLCYAAGRYQTLRSESGAGTALLGLCAFGLLALFSKENGALIFAYALVIEVIVFRFAAKSAHTAAILKTFFAITIGAPLLLLAGYLIAHPHWLAAAYSIRDFTLSQRLLTEPRVLCDYLLWTFIPLPHWLGFFHDDIITSTGILDPTTTLPAIVFLLALAGVAWKCRNSRPAISFGIAWFFVGHAMESTFLPLELVFEHRNYLPMAGLVLGTVCALAQLVWRWPVLARTGIALACVLTFTAITAIRAGEWRSPLALASAEVGNHPDSARAQYQLAREIIVDGATHNARDAAETRALPHLERSIHLDKTLLDPLIELILIRAKHGPVDPALLTELKMRLQQATYYARVNTFSDMLVRASMEPGSLTELDLAPLVYAALGNQHLLPSMRAMIMNNYGTYRFNILGDHQGAISLTLAAVATDPTNPYFELNLAKIALAVDDPARAQRYLDAASRLDKANYYGSEITKLRQRLAQ